MTIVSYVTSYHTADFVPARFDLYEFGGDRGGAPGRVVRRWFSGFNGAIGEPPQNVTLGWSDGEATVLVCSSGSASWGVMDARSRAAQLALGGTELPVPSRPASATDTLEEMARIASAHELWTRCPGVLADGRAAETITWGGFALGCLELGHGAIYLAAVGLDPAGFRVRQVADWAAYDIDASRSFPLRELRG